MTFARWRASSSSQRAETTRASVSVPLPALALLGYASGCGGGLPLLHPAATLPAGEVRAAAGFSGNVATGSFADALKGAQNEASAISGAPGPLTTDETYAKGALVAASVAPGLAPLVGARIGIGSHFEGGLMYTGRGMRADVRRSFESHRPHRALHRRGRVGRALWPTGRQRTARRRPRAAPRLGRRHSGPHRVRQRRRPLQPLGRGSGWMGAHRYQRGPKRAQGSHVRAASGRPVGLACVGRRSRGHRRRLPPRARRHGIGRLLRERHR